MRFNGVDLRQAHKALSISKEIPPGMPGRNITTVAGSEGEIVTGVDMVQDEYKVNVNIAARNKSEAWAARNALAAWAMSSGERTGELEPTHAPGRAYSAIVKAISPPEFVFGFTMVTVTFALPVPVMHDIHESVASAANATLLAFAVGGDVETQPVITYTRAAEGTNLLFTMDDVNMLRLSGSFAAKQKVEIDLRTGRVSIDGEAAGSRVVYTDTDLDVLLKPGRHTLRVSSTGNLEARWHNQWA